MLLQRLTLMLFLVCQLITIRAQLHYYSDQVQGGFVGDGYMAWFEGGQSTVQLPIPPGSTVKQAFLFSNLYKWQGNIIPAVDKTIDFNGNLIVLSESNSLNNTFYFSTVNNFVETVVVDVTSCIDPLISTYTINPFSNVSPVISPLFSDFYVLVIYENPISDFSAVDVFVNTYDAGGNLNYYLNTSSAVDAISDVGVAVHAWGICNDTNDWYQVSINSTIIGNIGGEEDNTTVYCAGMIGSFTYDNQTLVGIGNDVGNTTMDGLDGIANIQPYINGAENFDVKFDYLTNLSPNSNAINQLYLTYTSTCDTFSVNIPNDTTLCQGSTLQLNATSTNPSATYEWLPATGLSCSTCPNPIFTADSSMFYTVRIWNNDSCSVVRPLKINVRPQPAFGAITTTPSECGASTGSAAAGSVILNALPDNGIVANWQEVGGATQSSNVFAGLSAGNHTFNFIDSNGCQSGDTTVFVDEVNSTSANFSVSPQSGAVPLTVVFTNQSVNATNYEWFVSSSSSTSSMGSVLQSYEFTNSGTYEIMLVAWQFDPSCADTAYQTISVYDSLIVTIPNVFTPNGDGINDFFSLSASQDVRYEITLINRWGEVVFTENAQILAGTSKSVWDGTSTSSVPVTDGVYFMKLKLVPVDGEIIELEDFVTVTR